MDFCRDWTYNGTGPNDCRGGGTLRKPNVPSLGYELRKQYINQSPRGQQTSTSRFHIYKLDLDPVDAWTYGTAWGQTPEGLVRGIILELGEGGFANENGGALAGGTVELDWVRLVPRDGSTSVRLGWNGFGGRVTLVATHAETGDTVQVFPDDDSSATDFADNRSFLWDHGFLPPGHWSITASSGATSRTVSLTIDPAPLVTVLDPDETGGQDFAKTVLGDAWDMTNPADVQRYGWLRNVAPAQFGSEGFFGHSLPLPQAGAGDPDVSLVTDDFRAPANRVTIDGDRWHRLTFTLELDHPELKVPELLDDQWGSVARVIWRPVGFAGGLFTNSQDIWVMDGGPHTYTLDLAAMRRAGGRLCTDCDIEDTSETTMVAQQPWQGPMAALRIDPHEGTNARGFRIRDVTLAADDMPNGNGLFTIRWRVADATFSQSVANAAGADARVTLYWSSQRGGTRTLIAQGVNADLGAFTWNTSALPRGQAAWVSIDVTDASGNTTSRWSTGPLAVPSTPTISTDTDGDAMPDTWETRYGLSPASSADAGDDPDGDGVSNVTEFTRGTSPLIPNTWILAEGATGLFSERLALVNPEESAADVEVTFLREGQPPVVRDFALDGFGRLTIDVNAIDGMGATSASAVITAKTGAVVAERTMFWGNNRYGGHTGKALAHARTEWFLAEGNVGFFNTYILLANATDTEADVTLDFLLETGDAPAEPPIVYTVRVPARRRVTVDAGAVDVGGRRLTDRSFSTHITSTAPIMVERAMYFGADPPAPNFWPGGHDVPAVERPSTQWFVAEGTTGGGFNEYLLLANPNPTSTTATITYLTRHWLDRGSASHHEAPEPHDGVRQRRAPTRRPGRVGVDRGDAAYHRGTRHVLARPGPEPVAGRARERRLDGNGHPLGARRGREERAAGLQDLRPLRKPERGRRRGEGHVAATIRQGRPGALCRACRHPGDPIERSVDVAARW